MYLMQLGTTHFLHVIVIHETSVATWRIQRTWWLTARWHNCHLYYWYYFVCAAMLYIFFVYIEQCVSRCQLVRSLCTSEHSVLCVPYTHKASLG